MTNEEIRIAVAEEMGWTKRMTTEKQMCFPGGMQERQVERWFRTASIIELGTKEDDLPDYPNDLNACAEFEDSLDYANGDRQEYGSILKSVVWRDNGNLPLSQCRGTHRATPLQRCEAFLRLRNRWKD